jgi:hypothetical protein
MARRQTSRARQAALAIAALAAMAMAASGARGARADNLPPPPAVRQALDDAWWTGPMLANTPASAAPGHFLFEPYFYDVIAGGRFDAGGTRHPAPRANGFGSQSYLVYGVADHLGIGLIPNVGYDTIQGGPHSSAPGVGDWSLMAQYQLTQFHPGSWLPTTAVNVQETFPTGRYDRLGDRPSDGFGGGAYTTTLGYYAQTYLWLPNGRILRLRLNLSQAVSSDATVDGVSVYGTAPGFHGTARPGSTSTLDVAGEYSLTRSWVLASDLLFRHGANTRVLGGTMTAEGGVPLPPSIQTNLGATDAFGIAPALEYSWKPNLGVLLGARILAAGHNTAATITPALAINYVH